MTQPHKPAGSPGGSGGQFDSTGAATQTLEPPKPVDPEQESRQHFEAALDGDNPKKNVPALLKTDPRMADIIHDAAYGDGTLAGDRGQAFGEAFEDADTSTAEGNYLRTAATIHHMMADNIPVDERAEAAADWGRAYHDPPAWDKSAIAADSREMASDIDDLAEDAENEMEADREEDSSDASYL